MVKNTTDQLWNEIRKNKLKLDSCNMHVFEDIDPDKIFDKKFKCRNCDGVLGSLYVTWYELGVKHGLEDNKK